MDGEDVAVIIEAVDSWRAVLILLTLEFYLIFWKYGREMLSLMRETTKVTKNIKTDIITNHGSKNLGDAIDSLTENVGKLQASQAEINLRLENYIADHHELVEFGQARMLTALGERTGDDPAQ